MRSIIFLACIILLARASPANEGAGPSRKRFPQDLNRFILFLALKVRNFPDHHSNTFDNSFVSEVDDTLDEPPSHSARDLSALSNDFQRSAETFDRDPEPMEFNINEGYNGKLQAVKKCFWNDLEACECENMDVLLSGMTKLVNDKVEHSEQYLGKELSSHHEEKPFMDYKHDTGTLEKGTFIL